MDALHLVEWMAMDRIDAEDRKRAELAQRAEAGLKGPKRGRG